MPLMPAERARTRLESLAVAGLDVPTFSTAAAEVLRSALPYTAACFAPVDPATEILTSTVKWGGLTNDEDEIWAYHEYEREDLYDFRDVLRRPGMVLSIRHETEDDPRRSPRFEQFYEPTYGFADELRAGCRVDGVTWGFFALFRDGGGAFTPAEHAFISSIAPAFALGFRTGILAGAPEAVVAATEGPGVIVVDTAGDVVQANPAAHARVADLLDGIGGLDAGPLPFSLRALVGSARMLAEGRTPRIPRARLRTRSGQWVVAHASPLLSRDGTGTDVVVTIEEARPPEIVPLIVAAFGLTQREQDVVALVLRGVDTAEIARSLHLSAYTVQDHLKSIFVKVGVRSRRELTAKVFFDQYAPRLAAQEAVGPSGWFTPSA